MTISWRNSILFRTATGVVGIALVIGALFTFASSSVTAQLAQRSSTAQLGELLDTVESTVSIACFVRDRQLAREVVSGLLKNRGVEHVVISTDGQELARGAREGAAPAASAGHGTLVRAVASPFDKTKIVGEIRLEPNAGEISRSIRDQAGFVGLLLALQVAVVAAAVVVHVLRLVVRPIKAMSDGLHRLDAPAGERLATPPGHAENEIGRLVGDINDLAARLVRTLFDEHALRLQKEVDERKYHGIFDNAESGIFVAGRDGSLESCNRSFMRLTGQRPSAERPVGQRNLSALRWRERHRLPALITDCLANGEPRTADLEFQAGELASTWLRVTVSPVGRDLVQGIVSDVTQLKLSEVSARQAVVTDPLTGLGNRLALERRLIALIDGDADARFTLLLADLDGFTQINDAMGLPFGDRVLKEAAGRLVGSLKSSDWVARAGSDEFAVLLPDVRGHEPAAKVAARIVDALGRVFKSDDGPVFLGASVGVAAYPDDGGDVPTLLRNAELALNRARTTGGRHYQFFESIMVEAAEERRRLEADLRLSVERGELRLYLQPIVDLASRRVSGAEALVRWEHPRRGLVVPELFIPLAEEIGFIRDIGLWVLEAACNQLAQWQRDGLDWSISINVSARQIPDALPVATLLDTTARHGVDHGLLALEITEGVLMSDVSKALAWLQAVRAAGFRAYLDDFGTGYSSLSYLKRFPMDTVKVDKSFVRDMSENRSDRTLVEAIVAMARSLSLHVVAEGVETSAQLALLKQMGCGFAQGYLFSPPVPAEAFVDTVHRVAAQL